MSRKVHTAVIIIVWIFALLAVMATAAVSVCLYAAGPVTGTDDEYSGELRVPQGMTVREAAEILQEKKLIRSAKALYVAARFNLFDRTSDFSLKSGLYTVRSSMRLSEVYDLLQTGSPESIRISIPEGLTMSKTARLLQEAGICSADAFLDSCRSPQLLNEYNIPAQTFEGYLFPDTYFFTPDMKEDDIVRKLADNFFARAKTIEALQDKTPAQLNQIVILASIVEREYRAADEAPLIASVFTNRLKNNIGLYSCATIEYILTEIEGRPHPERITYNDLKIDSPYNTYRWAALPPAPISNPGLVALRATAQPAETDYFYFVLTNPAEGRHTFSKSFNQHKAAENLYTKKTP